MSAETASNRHKRANTKMDACNLRAPTISMRRRLVHFGRIGYAEDDREFLVFPDGCRIDFGSTTNALGGAGWRGNPLPGWSRT